jgi:predicted nucleotidyltransferase component of viral defense system
LFYEKSEKSYTVRYQLKRKQAEAQAQQAENTEDQTDITPVINFQWKEILRIMNTQKAVMTVSQNRYPLLNENL